MVATKFRFRHMLGLLAVLLALAGRLASGTVVPEPAAGRGMAALLDAMVQCGSDAPGPGHPAHHEADHGICCLACLLDVPAPTLGAMPAVPLRRGVIAMRVAVVPLARGPPPHPPGAALPRGPPVLA